jgi:hypothetical protein
MHESVRDVHTRKGGREDRSSFTVLWYLDVLNCQTMDG